MSQLCISVIFRCSDPAYVLCYRVTPLYLIFFYVWCNVMSHPCPTHYDDVIMTTIASQITSLTVVYSIVYSDADQIKHQSSASLAFVWGIHRRPVTSPHKWPVTRKMFSFDDVIMLTFVNPKYLWSQGVTNCMILCGCNYPCPMMVAHRWSNQSLLTYGGRDKMAAISQTMFSNAFSWMKIYEFYLRFHWSLFLRFQFTIFQHRFR